MTLGGLELGPQGSGSHGSDIVGSMAKKYFIISNMQNAIMLFFYLRFGFNLHAVKGSPIYPWMQVQVGM